MKALEEFEKLDISVKKKFFNIFDSFIDNHEISSTKFKKIIGTKLYEARVKAKSGIYRGIGGYAKPNFVVVLFFQKKTQRLPRKELKTALLRFNQLF